MTPFIAAAELADAAVRALTTPEASGRFLVSSAPVVGNDFAIAAGSAEAITEPAARAEIEAGATRCDTSKAEKVLGIKFGHKDAVLAQTIKAVRDFQARHML